MILILLISILCANYNYFVATNKYFVRTLYLFHGQELEFCGQELVFCAHVITILWPQFNLFLTTSCLGHRRLGLYLSNKF